MWISSGMPKSSSLCPNFLLASRDLSTTDCWKSDSFRPAWESSSAVIGLRSFASDSRWKVGEVIAHHIGGLSGNHRGVNFGVEWLAPSKGRLGDADLLLALVIFLHDLLHPNAIATAEKVPIGNFDWSSLGQRQAKQGILPGVIRVFS